MTAKQHVEVGGRSIALSNLDKVLNPGAAFTKAQVIDYYIRIAPWLLTALRQASGYLEALSRRRPRQGLL